MYVVSLIYRGAVRRRIRRLVRSRFFNNVRTATRNLDLPLAICDPILVPVLSYFIARFRPVHGGNTAGFFWGIRQFARRVFSLAA
jgi:hypothetical protein